MSKKTWIWIFCGLYYTVLKICESRVDLHIFKNMQGYLAYFWKYARLPCIFLKICKLTCIFSKICEARLKICKTGHITIFFEKESSFKLEGCIFCKCLWGWLCWGEVTLTGSRRFAPRQLGLGFASLLLASLTKD